MHAHLSTAICVVRDDKKIKLQPVKVKVFQQLVITCDSDAPVIWLQHFPSIPKGTFVSSDSTLVFNSIDLQNSGQYICFGFSDWNNRNFVATTEVTVYGKLFNEF